MTAPTTEAYLKPRRVVRFGKNKFAEFSAVHEQEYRKACEDQGVKYGHCFCTCGGTTAISKRTDPQSHRVRGFPARYIPGHKGKRDFFPYTAEDCGYASACWIWQGTLNADGYGEFSVSSKRKLAHRVIYERHRGAIPEGLDIDHLCKVHSCVNPDHLEAVTNKENIRRGEKTKLNAEKVRLIREMRATGLSGYKIAAAIGVGNAIVYQVINGTRWADV